MKVSPTEVDLASTKIEEQLVIHTTPTLIHTALPDGNIDFFNRRWLEYLGLTLEDVQGWRWTAAIHPEDVLVGRDLSNHRLEFVGSVMDVTAFKCSQRELEDALQEIAVLKDQLFKENIALR